MAIQDQGTLRPLSEDLFFYQPYYREDLVERPTSSTTKGVDLMLGLLIDQYQQKPNLQEYFAAFFEEMDYLFNQLDEVYLGRLLDYAEGVQLDVIGEILNLGRSIPLPGVFFGFVGAADVDKMADQATPGDGGLFKDQYVDGYTIVPLNDSQYRRVLKAKGMCHSRHGIDVNHIYNVSSTLLGFVPEKMELSITAARQLELIISRDDTTSADAAMLSYFSDYMIPMGTTFVVTRIVLP